MSNSQLTFHQKDVAKFLLGGPHEKGERYLFLALWVLKLEALLPGLKWKITDLARHSGVSRSWIYEFFGRNRALIFELALKVVTEDFYGRSEARKNLKEKYGMMASLFRSRYIIQHFPEILVFYYRSQWANNKAGKLLRQEERQFLRQLKSETGLSEIALLNFRVSIHGLMTAPFLDDVEVETCLRALAFQIS